MVGIESLAMGIPVIASDNRGTREYMLDGKNGYVCRWNDLQAFKQSILTYKNLSLNQKQAMRSNCRISVKKFDKDNTHLIMEKIYRRLDQEVYSNGG